MTQRRLVRDYENPELPLEKRLPSLARRFPCLSKADGLDEWSAERFHAWIVNKGADSHAWHAGHLVLNLFEKGPWEKFDAVSAICHWDDESRSIFAAWAISWH
jgi:hypothetical protein